jgi:hypothetical protein
VCSTQPAADRDGTVWPQQIQPAASKRTLLSARRLLLAGGWRIQQGERRVTVLPLLLLLHGRSAAPSTISLKQPRCWHACTLRLPWPATAARPPAATSYCLPAASCRRHPHLALLVAYGQRGHVGDRLHAPLQGVRPRLVCWAPLQHQPGRTHNSGVGLQANCGDGPVVCWTGPGWSCLGYCCCDAGMAVDRCGCMLLLLLVAMGCFEVGGHPAHSCCRLLGMWPWLCWGPAATTTGAVVGCNNTVWLPVAACAAEYEPCRRLHTDACCNAVLRAC